LAPSKITCPAVGSSSRSNVRPTVVLPQPDSPTSPTVSPRKISNDNPSTARTSTCVGLSIFKPALTSK
jgi:hypothetical protein